MNSKSDPRWAYPLVNLATLLWATNFALGRLFRNEIGPFTLTAARFTVAAIILSIWGSRLPAQERAPGRQSALLFGMGLTGVFGFGWLLYSGLQHTTVTNAALMNGTAPLIIGLLAALLLKERFSPQSILGAIISLSGVAVIVSGGSLEVLLRQQWNVGICSCSRLLQIGACTRFWRASSRVRGQRSPPPGFRPCWGCPYCTSRRRGNGKPVHPPSIYR